MGRCNASSVDQLTLLKFGDQGDLVTRVTIGLCKSVSRCPQSNGAFSLGMDDLSKVSSGGTGYPRAQAGAED